MLKIIIDEEAPTLDSLADLLEHVASQVRGGSTSGYGPDWSLDGEEEEPEQDDH